MVKFPAINKGFYHAVAFTDIICVSINWNVDADGSGKRYFTAKATLDKFYEKLKSKGKINFQIAYHAYPQGMSDPVFWDDTQAANSTNAKIINFVHSGKFHIHLRYLISPTVSLGLLSIPVQFP